jgi:hypothetical protein
MSKIYKLDIHLPQSYTDLLTQLVDKARAQNTLTGLYQISVDGIHHIDIGDGLEFRSNLSGYPFAAFEVLGFIALYEKDATSGSFVITPSAFEYIDFLKKNKFTKWWIRLPDGAKAFVVGFSFVISLSVTLLEGVKILVELLRPIP